MFTTYIGERISDLKLGNGTSLLIFTSILSYLPASFGRTVAQAFQDANYIGLVAIIISFFLLVLSIVYVQVWHCVFLWITIQLGKHRTINSNLTKEFQEAERKIPINYASRYTSRTGGLQKSAYLPFKVCITFLSFVQWVFIIIFFKGTHMQTSDQNSIIEGNLHVWITALQNWWEFCISSPSDWSSYHMY